MGANTGVGDSCGQADEERKKQRLRVSEQELEALTKMLDDADVCEKEYTLSCEYLDNALRLHDDFENVRLRRIHI